MTFNVNGLSSPVKICRMTDWARKLDRPICCLQGTHFRCKGMHKLKVEGQKDIIRKYKPKDSWDSYTIIRQNNSKTKTLIRDKESNNIMKNGSILQEDVMFVNIYASNLGAPKYIKQILTDVVAQMVKNLPKMQGTWIQFLDQEDTLEKGRTTHSSIIARGIPWTEEYGGLTVHGIAESNTTE